jgi:hypothetical protein
LSERGCSSFSFLTSALEGAEWSASRPGRALFPGREPPVPIVREGGWARAGLDTECRGKMLCVCRGHHTDSATRMLGLETLGVFPDIQCYILDDQAYDKLSGSKN